MMARICNPSFIAQNATRIRDCKSGVDQIAMRLTASWQNVRRECGPWKWDGFTGNPASQACTTANNDLMAKASYTNGDGIRFPVTLALTESVKAGLWQNKALFE